MEPGRVLGVEQERDSESGQVGHGRLQFVNRHRGELWNPGVDEKRLEPTDPRFDQIVEPGLGPGDQTAPEGDIDRDRTLGSSLLDG